ncbi:uncharacterized protein BJX67DRAFT_385637 [Aspergillus lucknowensis]|uniref:Homeobox and C2H2 transcription factor n=1 Tax=Aspergillus lucknowensis TaxID=176173 RepID=A0ABR4LCX7_9EURO
MFSNDFDRVLEIENGSFTADPPFDDEFSQMFESWQNTTGQHDPFPLEFDSIFPQLDAPSADDGEAVKDDDPVSPPTGGLGTISKAAVSVLSRWFDEHSNSPYPRKEEKLSLAEESGLSVPQVSTWFANARRRQRYRKIQARSNRTSLSPLERWKNSPPEDEGASIEAIRTAVATSRPTSAQSVVSSHASGSARSYNSSVYSAGSHSSSGSFGRFYAAEPSRRRRSRKSLPSASIKKTSLKATGKKDRLERPYQCTFCTDTFRTKYDWTRHEKTLHLSLEYFTCCPSGPTYVDEVEKTTRCALCDHDNPSNHHIESHSYSKCQEKPPVLRTFYRKDHLVQHLRLMHEVYKFLPAMEGWKYQVDKVNSRCGFCCENFSSWAERNKHIARHFRKGALMKDWRGSRGLEPHVSLAVENAMPPYMISYESSTPNPFSASRTVNISQEETGSAVQPSIYEAFTIQLTKAVRCAAPAGEPITDNLIQREARRLAYGDDDPWNQTPADNSEWLKLFKVGLGLQPADGHTEIRPFQQPWSCEESWVPWKISNIDPPSPNVSDEAGDLLPWGSMPWAWQSPECFAEFRRYFMEDTEGS